MAVNGPPSNGKRYVQTSLPHKGRLWIVIDAREGGFGDQMEQIYDIDFAGFVV